MKRLPLLGVRMASGFHFTSFTASAQFTNGLALAQTDAANTSSPLPANFLGSPRALEPFVRVAETVREAQTNEIGEALIPLLAIARRVREQTTMTLKWIGQRLQMESWTSVGRVSRTRSPPRREN